jgi:hypothetical protein
MSENVYISHRIIQQKKKQEQDEAESEGIIFMFLALKYDMK